MRSRPSLFRAAGAILALPSLALLAPGPARAAGTLPNYFYQVVTSSANQLRVMGANASSVLVREIGPAGESLADYPLTGAAPQVIARAGGPFPGGGTFPANTQFSQATEDGNGNVPFRAFSSVDAKTWQVATLIYSSATQQSTALQPFVSVPSAVKAQLDQPFDSNGLYSVRTTALVDGSLAFARWLNDETGATGVVAQTGDKIDGTAGETVKTVGPPRIDSASHIFVPVASNQGNAYLERFSPATIAAGAASWQLSGAASFPAGFLIQQVVLSKPYSDGMVVLGTSPGAPGAPFWAVDWTQSNNPTAAPVSIADKVLAQSRVDLRSATLNQDQFRFSYDLQGGPDEYHLGFVFPGLGVQKMTFSFAAALPRPTLTDLEPVFGPNQGTPLGIANPLADPPAAFWSRDVVFGVSVPNNGNAIVAASSFPCSGPVPIGVAGQVVYTGASGTQYNWNAAGPGLMIWSDPISQPGGGWALPFQVSAFRIGFLEPDGTPWSIFCTVPSGGMLTIPPDHFGSPAVSVSLYPQLTVGPRSFPTVPWSGTGSFNPLTAGITLNGPGQSLIGQGQEIFQAGDQAKLEYLYVSDASRAADQTTTSPGMTSSTYPLPSGKVVEDRTDDGKGNGTTTLTLYDNQNNKTGTIVVVRTNDGKGKRTTQTTLYDAQGQDISGSLVVETDDGKGHRTTTRTPMTGRAMKWARRSSTRWMMATA